MEKVLIECCLELYAAGLVIGIQDLGGAGLSCATSELASAGDGGMADPAGQGAAAGQAHDPRRGALERVAERMCAVVSPENVDAFMAVCRKWEVLATVIGEVTDGDHLQITWNGETVVDVPPRRWRTRDRLRAPVARPDTQDALIADTSAKLPRPGTGDELRATLLALVGSPHLCSRAFITEQYGPLRPWQHRAGRARRRRGVAHRRGGPARGIAVSTDASGATPNSTRTPEPSWRWPRPTATSPSPAPRPRGDQLPELRVT